MKKPKRVLVEKVSSIAQYKLPVAYSREIGRIIVRWAYFEQHVQIMVSGVAFAADAKSTVIGRMAVVSPPFPERLELLRRLADERSFGFDNELLLDMKPRSKALSQTRNLIAHGIWTNDPKWGWTVQETRGNWGSNNFGPHVSKKIVPEVKIMKPENLAITSRDIEALICDARRLKESFSFEQES